MVVLLLAASACSKEAPPAAPPPPEVLVTEPIQRDVPVSMELVGQAKGFQDVEIRARVEGFLETVAFTEGSLVRKGQLLYQIDPKALQAAVANAKGQLATAQARLEKAKNDVNRFTPLVAKQAVSQQELDNAAGGARTRRPPRSTPSRRPLEKTQIDLGYTTITAPIDGLIGTTQVKAGNLVGRGESTLLVTISQIDPILFRAGIAEAEYLRWPGGCRSSRRRGPAAQTPIQLILADGSVHPHEGRLDAVERNIDTTTGTIALQIKFPNPERLVRPGQFGRVRFVIDQKKSALLVPQRAVQELQNLYSLAVVGADNKVSFRNVKVGPREDSLWVIEEGLKPGERVIVEGLQRVREGLVVAPKAAPAERLRRRRQRRPRRR